MNRVSVVIVTWNSQAVIGPCLRAVESSLAGVPHEVIVVDNASSDGTVGAVRTSGVVTRLVANARNEGFAAGVDRGADGATGTYLLVLNPDTELDPESFAVLADTLDGDPGAAIAGPALVDPEGRASPGAGGYLPTPLTVLASATGLGRIADGPRWIRGLWLSDAAGPRWPAEWVSGAAMLVRRDVFETLSGFDERYFLLCEDIDLCARARDAGWGVRYLPAARVLHHEGTSIARQDDDVLDAVGGSLRTYLTDRYGRVGSRLTCLPLSASYRLRLAAYSARARLRGRDRDDKRLMLVRKHLRTLL